MNNLFSESWRRDVDSSSGGDVQMSSGIISSIDGGGANLDKFFEDVEVIKEELKEVEQLHRGLHESNEALKTLHAAAAVRDLRARMDADVSCVLRKAKLIKLRLESLDRSNSTNRAAPGCGPGTSMDRIRTSQVVGLRKKLKESMEAFGGLRERVALEYREAVGRRYYTVTGERADEATVEALVATGEGERFLARVIREQGRGQVADVITEIQERHGAASELERSLAELQQVFMDMAVLVAAQGEQLDDIEAQIGRAASVVLDGAEQLQTARKHQRNTHKWARFGILLLVVISLIIVAVVLNKVLNKK